MTVTARHDDKFCSVVTRGGILCLYFSPSKKGEIITAVDFILLKLQQKCWVSGDRRSGLGTIRTFYQMFQRANQCMKLNYAMRQSNSSVALQVYLWRCNAYLCFQTVTWIGLVWIL